MHHHDGRTKIHPSVRQHDFAQHAASVFISAAILACQLRLAYQIHDEVSE
jgi:hypothetical protein